MFDYTADDFIDSKENPNLFQWIFSKGTSYECYNEFMNKASEAKMINMKSEVFTTLITSIVRPLEFYYFYWTLLIFVMNKFNFKKIVMKFLLFHLLLRCTADILDQIANVYKYYFSYQETYNNDTQNFICINESMHPMKWLISKQIAMFCFYSGEIVADWYPLIRIRDFVKRKTMRSIYITCGLFNLSKLLMVVLHWSLSPTIIYNKITGAYNQEIMDKFNIKYWNVQLIIVCCTLLYQLSIFWVLRRKVIYVNPYPSNYGFIKKIKSVSEYRIYFASILTLVLLPFILVTFSLKLYFYYSKGVDLELHFETFRKSIVNFSYFMIFIDQVFLVISKYERTLFNFNLYRRNKNINQANNIYTPNSSGSVGTIEKESYKDYNKKEDYKILNDNDIMNDINPFNSNNPKNYLLSYKY